MQWFGFQIFKSSNKGELVKGREGVGFSRGLERYTGSDHTGFDCWY